MGDDEFVPRVDDRPHMTCTTPIDPTVPRAEKDDAKAFGARWDRDDHTWYPFDVKRANSCYAEEDDRSVVTLDTRYGRCAN